MEMRKWLIAGGVALLVTLVAGRVAVKRIAAWLPNYLRERATSTLHERFASDVQFGDLQILVYPKIVIRGERLVLRFHGRQDIPPLVSVAKFSTEVGLGELFRRTHRLRKITLEGLRITMPPASAPEAQVPRKAKARKSPVHYRVAVDEIDADDAELDLMVREPNKPPRVFFIHHLQLYNAGLGQPMSYHARLTNPIPVGEIDSEGHVGPWQRDEPGLTPLDGAYTFSHADLSSIKGLGGILFSKGKFAGQLYRIDVQGYTTTPDFSLGISDHPVPLETQFHAIVDGTTGNTMLEPVHAKLLNSEFVARGGVFRIPGQAHRRVLLDAVSSGAKLEDLLRLALKADEPPMTGVVGFRTRIDIPPGKGAIADRMRLDGQFNITSGRFSRLDLQKKVAAFSRRSRGDTDQDGVGSVVSNFGGRFVLGDDVINFTRLTFGVPGASVNLDGTYRLRGENMDFRGSLRLQAKVSQLMKGWKSKLLVPFDPLFEKKGAGTFLPITITGTGSNPHFGLDIRHVF
jgi:hypothetical protein